MGDPEIAAIDIILDQDQAPSRPQITVNELQNALFTPLEMEGVGHHYAVERRQVEGARVIDRYRLQMGAGKALVHFPLLAAQCVFFLIDGINLCPWP